MTKRIIFLLFLFFFYKGNTQNISDSKIYKLSKLNVETKNLDLNDLNIQNDLNKILKLERKRKSNKTLGIIFSSISAFCFIAGGILISKGNNTTAEGHDFATPIGTIMVTGGVVYGGISIPFWTLSKKRKKERDELIKMFHK